MRFLFLVLTVLNAPAWADPVKDVTELALLPQYCKGTQLIREISKDPIPIKQYVAMYGHAFTHLHHYCWALNTENKALKMRGEARQSKLRDTLGDYKYIIDLAPPDFVLLPDIYTSRAQVFFQLKRNVEAVADLNKAIELRPDYSRAYARLSDYYQLTGDTRNAIKILEQGIGNAKNGSNTGLLIRKLGRLGKTYQAPPGSAIPQEATPPQDQDRNQGGMREHDSGTGIDHSVTPEKVTLPENNSTESLAPAPPKNDASPDQPANPNPYCRFCP